jgi:hypothetical protein
MKKDNTNISEYIRMESRIDKYGNIYFVANVSKPVMIDMSEAVILVFTSINPDNLRKNRVREDEYTANMIVKFQTQPHGPGSDEGGEES